MASDGQFAGQRASLTKDRPSRPRRSTLADVQYKEVGDSVPAAPRVPYEQLSRQLLEGPFARLSAITEDKDLTAQMLRSTGFQDPVLVKQRGSLTQTHKARITCNWACDGCGAFIVHDLRGASLWSYRTVDACCIPAIIDGCVKTRVYVLR